MKSKNQTITPQFNTGEGPCELSIKELGRIHRKYVAVKTTCENLIINCKEAMKI